jgi:hypothetical protein
MKANDTILLGVFYWIQARLFGIIFDARALERRGFKKGGEA